MRFWKSVPVLAIEFLLLFVIALALFAFTRLRIPAIPVSRSRERASHLIQL